MRPFPADARPSALDLRDAMARITAALEGISVGDYDFALSVLGDLRVDLWRVIERLEREVRP